jgi:hypothetical protein
MRPHIRVVGGGVILCDQMAVHTFPEHDDGMLRLTIPKPFQPTAKSGRSKVAFGFELRRNQRRERRLKHTTRRWARVATPVRSQWHWLCPSAASKVRPHRKNGMER